MYTFFVYFCVDTFTLHIVELKNICMQNVCVYVM